MSMFVVRVSSQGNEYRYIFRESESILELRVIMEGEGYEVLRIHEARYAGKGKVFAVKDSTGFLMGFFGPDILRAMATDGIITADHSLLVGDENQRHGWVPAWMINDLLPSSITLGQTLMPEVSNKLDATEEIQIKQLKVMYGNRMIDGNEYISKMAKVLGLSSAASQV